MNELGGSPRRRAAALTNRLRRLFRIVFRELYTEFVMSKRRDDTLGFIMRIATYV